MVVSVEMLKCKDCATRGVRQRVALFPCPSATIRQAIQHVLQASPYAEDERAPGLMEVECLA